MDTPELGLAGASLAVSSFVSASHPTESCGINGLPLTPHSISILGAGQLLLTCQHQNLTRYQISSLIINSFEGFDKLSFKFVTV